MFAFALVVTGCASPPEAEKKAAEDAVNAARAAGAEKYAANDFGAASAALKDAEGQMGAKKYSEAKTAYVKAKELADKAAKAAPAGKTAMKAEVDAAVADAEKKWQELEGKVKAAARKLKPDQKKAWEADTRSAGEALQAAKTAAADDPIGAKEKLGPVTAAIEKWEGELKAAAPPAKAEAPKK
jgi:predicted  nucleic acid-binding Zn-ribbon protein